MFQHGNHPGVVGASLAFGSLNLPTAEQWNKGLHFGLDTCGLAPAWGALCDVPNGIWYFQERKYVEALWSLAGAVPGPTEFAKDVRYTTKALAGIRGVTTNKGTNARGELESRGSWRKPVVADTWASALAGPNGGRMCAAGCGVEVMVPPNTGVMRDWDMSHFPSWTNRDIPSDWARRQVLDEYNRGIILECPKCNRSGQNDDSRFEGR